MISNSQYNDNLDGTYTQTGCNDGFPYYIKSTSDVFIQFDTECSSYIFTEALSYSTDNALAICASDDILLCNENLQVYDSDTLETDGSISIVITDTTGGTTGGTDDDDDDGTGASDDDDGGNSGNSGTSDDSDGSDDDDDDGSDSGSGKSTSNGDDSGLFGSSECMLISFAFFLQFLFFVLGRLCVCVFCCCFLSLFCLCEFECVLFLLVYGERRLP